MKRRINRRKRRKRFYIFIIAVMSISVIITLSFVMGREDVQKTPGQVLLAYMDCISKKRYGEMYGMLAGESAAIINRKDFIKRNSAIYEGTGAKNITVDITGYDQENLTAKYNTSFDTAAGNVCFMNEVSFLEEDGTYKMVWNDSVIFPGLGAYDKVRVSTIQARRGEILDRNGKVLAGKGVASSVGIIPGKLESKKKSIKKIAKLLGVEPENIEKQLSAKWVKDDSLVPVKTLPKVKDASLLMDTPDKDVLREYKRQKKLSGINGVVVSDIETREYPLKEAAAHLVGYVQNVTAEDLEKHAGEGYTSSSVIGKTGIEGLFEKELKGKNGCRIYITGPEGEEKEELAYTPVQHGQNIKLTVDASLQLQLYESFKTDKGCSVSINPFTGEVLALTSTPSYDSNAFIMGMSVKQWNLLNNDGRKPLYNRFRQAWCPGSSLKPVTAAIGLQSGAINPEEDFGNEGRRWQKDKSWGTYYVTTLHTYNPVVLENALVYSDNIYFAKAALKIGAAEMERALSSIGFNREIPFEIKMGKSGYSNTRHIESEIQLADSGYGQGQVLVNPLHMACIYTAFCNNGNIIKPYLLYKKNVKAEYWITGAFSKKTSKKVLDGIIKVVNNPHGTGYAAHREDIVLAGKTGTAEIKASKEDTSGTELGWFTVLTPDKNVKKPVLIVSMAEDVNGRGGSGYVTRKVKKVLGEWFSGNQ